LSTDPAPRPAPPVGAFLLLALAALLYVAMLASISDLGATDAPGRGIALAFGMLYGLALWLVLGLLLVIGAVNGEMPVWGRIAAAVLVPAGAVAAAAVADSIEREGWLIVVPAGLPPIYALYAMWARLPRTHRILPPKATGAVVWGAALLLMLAPVPVWIADTVATARREAEELRESAAREAAAAQRRQAELARFRKVTAASPLWEWAEFIGEGKEFDAQAIAGARALAHRQADAEIALRRGMGFPLVELWRLDLAATPGFCAAAAQFLPTDAATHPPPAGSDAYAAYAVIQKNFSPYLDAVEWLTQQGCDIDDAVAQVAQVAAAYPPSSSRDGFLGVLAWRRGNGFYKRREWDRAVKSYSEALRHDPDNAQFFKNRGDAEYAKGDYDRAVADYSEAVGRSKFYDAAFDSRGNAYLAKGEDDRALADYDEAIRLNPKSAPAFNNRGNLFDRKGEHRKAIADFDKALQLDPQSRIMLNNRGRAHFYGGDYRPGQPILPPRCSCSRATPTPPCGSTWRAPAPATMPATSCAPMPVASTTPNGHGRWSPPIWATAMPPPCSPAPRRSQASAAKRISTSAPRRRPRATRRRPASCCGRRSRPVPPAGSKRRPPGSSWPGCRNSVGLSPHPYRGRDADG
jgi:tetratricopeptide (TPR) repeat protein